MPAVREGSRAATCCSRHGRPSWSASRRLGSSRPAAQQQSESSQQTWPGRSLLPLGSTATLFLDALARSSVLAIPSRFELAPIALAEAWAARVPVVATDVGGVPAIARGAARLVAADVPGELAAAIVEALTDTRGNAQLVGEGNRRAQMQRADSVASAHLRLYEDLCER